jgi:hypothetical protein
MITVAEVYAASNFIKSWLKLNLPQRRLKLDQFENKNANLLNPT